MAKKIKCDIQCSNCGKRTELTNTVDDAVRVIKSGWDSINQYLTEQPQTTSTNTTDTTKHRKGRNGLWVCMMEKSYTE